MRYRLAEPASHARDASSGFTLLELLIAITMSMTLVAGLLATVALTQRIGQAFDLQMSDVNDRRTVHRLLGAYARVVGTNPTGLPLHDGVDVGSRRSTPPMPMAARRSQGGALSICSAAEITLDGRFCRRATANWDSVVFFHRQGASALAGPVDPRRGAGRVARRAVMVRRAAAGTATLYLGSARAGRAQPFMTGIGALKVAVVDAATGESVPSKLVNDSRRVAGLRLMLAAEDRPRHRVRFGARTRPRRMPRGGRAPSRPGGDERGYRWIVQVHVAVRNDPAEGARFLPARSHIGTPGAGAPR